MKRLIGVLTATACFCPIAARANNLNKSRGKMVGQISEGHRLPAYGMAGCGFGSMIFPNRNTRTDGITQLSAATLNDSPLLIPSSVSALTGAFAAFGLPIQTVFIPGVYPTTSQMTSIGVGTSNCTDDPTSREAMRQETHTYIAVNFTDLTKQAAQAQGMHLQNLATILGCGDETNFRAFARTAQNSHTYIFADSTPEQVTQRLIQMSKNDSRLNLCLHDFAE